MFQSSGDYRLGVGSPCKDRVDDMDGAPETDIRGIARPLRSGYDMGAYEMENARPEVSGDAVGTTEDSPVDLTLYATDADSDPLQFAVTVEPEHGVLSGTFPDVRYTPYSDWSGDDSFLFKVDDGFEESETALISVAVEPVADTPLLNVESPATGPEDSSIALSIDPPELADADGSESLGDITVSGVPAGFSLSAGTDTGDGSWSLATGQLSGLTVNSPADYFGQFDLTVEISSSETGNGDTATASQTIQVVFEAVDDSPVVSSPIDNVSTQEDSADTTIDLSGVFSDIDNDDGQIVKSVLSNSNPSLVETAIDGDALTLRYLENQNGSATISIQALSNGKTVDNEFAVTVAPVDDDSVVSSPIDKVSTQEDSADTTIDLSGVFSDIDNDDGQIVKSVLSNSNPSLVETAIDGDALTLRYLENQNGSATISIQALSNGKTVAGEFTVTVAPVNDAPEALTQQASTQENSSVDILLAGEDVDGDDLTFSIVENPKYGNIYGEPPQVTYVPFAHYYGDDQFSFEANDGQLDSPASPVLISVESVPGTVDFTVSKSRGQAPLTVQFSDMTTDNPSAWFWDFDYDDAVDSNWRNPLTTYLSEGLLYRVFDRY